ncbi:MAG TPA: formyltransferase family protein, partial [Burkholderiaceae bacterium]|nr:formyltransferase family protein [Burkholderiaceae bacterium]
RLALRAQALGIPMHVQHDRGQVSAAEIADGSELVVAAHTHARVTADAVAKARLGGIGYHPSLLPRHRGIAAVEWTVKCGDAIAGGSIYHLAERMDAGAIAAQDWCFVKPGEGARELWERALAPLGIRLLTQVVAQASATGVLPAQPQDEQFATQAPKLPR